MKKIMTRRITPYVVILVGFAIILVGSYHAVAAEITCSICIPYSTYDCDHGLFTPGGLPTCYNIPQVSCTSYSCRRCDDEFASSVKVCIASDDSEDYCTLTGETEDCGTLHSRVCEWNGYSCTCPDSGGDPVGNCVFDECVDN
ncbi:hypothetical protein ACFLZ8_01145 [Planctomycetota bacterium]